MPIDFYQLPMSVPCRPVLMAARHLNIEVNLKELNFMEGDHMKPEYLKMNPQHCIPTIVDNGFVLWESRAIMQYFVNQYSPGHSLYPLDPKKRATIDRLLQFDLGSLFPPIFDYIFPQVMLEKAADPEKEKVIHEKLKLLEKFLEGSKYVAGDNLSLADLSILATVTSLQAFQSYDISRYANVIAWIGLLERELPYYHETVVEPCKLMAAFVAEKLSKSNK